MRINLEEEAIMNQVELTVDGSAIGNPGPGGWCCILRCGDAERVLTGSHADTTNNRMELTAAIQGLRALTKKSIVKVMTDSQYVVSGMTQWVAGWKANGWIAASRRPVLNRDLWEELVDLAGQHEVQWVWIQGHNPHNKDQDRADRLAVAAARQRATGVHN